MRAVNLIPGEQRRGTGGPRRSGGAAYAVLVVLGGVALLALLYGKAHRQASSRQAQVTSLTARAQQAESKAAQLAPYSSFVALREQRTQAVSELVDSRFDWAHALHELGRVLPADASISMLNGTIGSAGATGSASPTTSSSSAKGAAASTVSSATPAGSVPTITLGGCATSQAEVAQTLERLRLIQGVNEVTLQSSTKSASGGAGNVSCSATSPAFTVLITFEPLPSGSPATPATGSPTPASSAGAPAAGATAPSSAATSPSSAQSSRATSYSNNSPAPLSSAPARAAAATNASGSTGAAR